MSEDALFDPLDPLTGSAFSAGDNGGTVAIGCVGLNGEELPDEKIGEAGFVEQAAGGFTEVSGHETTCPGKVLVRGGAESVKEGSGLRNHGTNGGVQLGKEIAQVVEEPRIRKDEGEALMTVAGLSADRTSCGACKCESQGWKINVGSSRETELRVAVEVKVQAQGVSMQCLWPRFLRSMRAGAGVPETSGSGELERSGRQRWE